jgi:pre-mRNA cleavage complex 2 protein Pcf11
MDQAAQSKLTTLQTLKEILEAGTSSPRELVDIRQSITAQMARKQAAMPPMPPMPPMPQQTPYPQYPPQQHYPGYPPQYSYPPQQPQPAPTPSLNLADLLRQNAPQTYTPPIPYSAPYASRPPVMSTPPVINAVPAPAAAPENPLIAALRAQGLLSASSTPPQAVTPPLPGFAGIVPPPIEVTFTSASIKIPRPHLVASFLNARPNQCSTCGRRFTSDDTGKEKKARHLDWHFKTKTRMMEAEKRGQNRSWYVDEREWIASREYDDDAPEQVNGTSPSKQKKQDDFVRVPSDPALRNSSCPIDQEPFQSEWSEELQDFIWKDAVKVGGKYYHASCFREVTKDRDQNTGGLTPIGAGVRTATPDSVLGKRKAEQEANGVKSKVKTET